MINSAVSMVGDVLKGIISGKSVQTLDRPPVGNELAILRVSAVTWGKFRPEECKAMPADYEPGDCPRAMNGDILISRANTRELVGAPVIVKGDYPNLLLSDKLLKLLPDESAVDRNYLVWALRSPAAAQHFARCAGGTSGSMTNITQENIRQTPILLPELAEQRRIAAILDHADALKGQRRQAIAELDKLAQAVFVEMFGDPASNPCRWPETALGQTAEKFSDGPFGSNLKSSHYTESGIRVIRLQNIGIGELVDNDRAFVSGEHFKSLRKHECRPGDVLIATLGDPNLRACIQPAWMEIALNKADCVQLRPRRDIANARYLCALLNHPSVEGAAQELMTGQTRVRISMGRLRGLRIPLPPISLQNEFDARMSAVDSLKATHRAAFSETDALFVSLQQRAFSGAL